MTNVILDNIIFNLQNAGGISGVWQEHIQRILNDVRFNIHFIEYDKVKNMNRSVLNIPQTIIDLRSSNFLKLKRYINPFLSVKDPFIFHSSYFRTCSNRYATNITTVHDFTYEYYSKGIRARVHKWQKYMAIRNSKAIICISNNTKQDLLKFLPDINPDKIYVIYNGVSEDYYKIEQTLQNIPFGGDYLLYVGARGGYKNFKFLVESISEIKENLVIVGGNLNENEDNLLNTYLKGKYKYLGRLSNQELNIIYNGAKALVYPSSYEGFGIPILEAQKAGCPVIALNCSSITEIIGETPLIMKELTRSEILEKIEYVNNESIRKEVSANGLENSSRFSWDKTYQQTSALYEYLFD